MYMTNSTSEHVDELRPFRVIGDQHASCHGQSHVDELRDQCHFVFYPTFNVQHILTTSARTLTTSRHAAQTLCTPATPNDFTK